jgi:hypothetical protein
MTRAIRWRVIVLQIVAVLVLGFGAFGADYASSFIGDQVRAELAPQQIVFPASAAAGLPADLAAYAGQQVLTGDQAHAYADDFIGLHLQKIGQGHPYAYWSAQALAASDPTVKAADQAIADTLFKGETLRTMLTEAWTFSVVAQIAFWAGLGLALAGGVVLATLAFELLEVRRGLETVDAVRTMAGRTTPGRTTPGTAIAGPVSAEATPARGELASVK